MSEPPGDLGGNPNQNAQGVHEHQASANNDAANPATTSVPGHPTVNSGNAQQPIQQPTVQSSRSLPYLPSGFGSGSGSGRGQPQLQVYPTPSIPGAPLFSYVPRFNQSFDEYQASLSANQQIPSIPSAISVPLNSQASPQQQDRNTTVRGTPTGSGTPAQQNVALTSGHSAEVQQYLEACQLLGNMLGYIPQDVIQRAPPEAMALLQQPVAQPTGQQEPAPVVQQAQQSMGSSHSAQQANLAGVQLHQPVPQQYHGYRMPTSASEPVIQTVHTEYQGNTYTGRTRVPHRTGGSPKGPRPHHSISRWQQPFSYKNSLLELARDTTAKDFNIFRVAFSMIRKGSFVSFSHITSLEKKAQWLDWIGGIKHILMGQNLLGWILEDDEVLDTTPPWSMPVYPIDKPREHMTTDDHDFNGVWWLIDSYVKYYLLGPLTSQVRSTLDHEILRRNIRQLTSRDVYSILRSEYGTIDYNQGRALWLRAEAMECGSNVATYVRNYEKLIDEVRRSSFDGLTPHIAISNMMRRLPDSLRYLTDNWRMKTVKGWIVGHNDWAEFLRWKKDILSAYEGHVAEQYASRVSGGVRSAQRATVLNQPRPATNPSSNRPTPVSNLANAKTRQAAVICYNCQKPGHTKANCPEPGGDLSGKQQSAKGYLAADGGDVAKSGH
ncbi:hypothetical protein CC1G_00600 [Coprinopsis cinerea okayama7|uniref:CCHC-type domain-containing protein n=1 Tax=Coprinopsis cinerea (strain Okayama-7 / 130 / ATCC MYA-4618 / FGSC 9003) TaxID=240176 RepID=A8N3S9_COPC7|nr:hypothetical protein CC1G_00600 [Coprinopsis cinerea okayama7\|eukprot:XP_001829421.1 hypothetical protein CC1G_00600 [Coprinopsis cinerea okayama7\